MGKILTVVVVFLGLLGCSNSVAPNESGNNALSLTIANIDTTGVNILTSPIVSDPANDPYSVENMNKAMRRRVLAKSSVDSVEAEQMFLEPNFLYVRFLAEGREGVAKLKAYDTSLVLFKHPLDYNRIRKPVVYIDQTLPDSVYPFFATVPVDYKFGSTKYEIIKELFLVEPLDGDCKGDECEEESDSSATVNALFKRLKAKAGSPTLSKLKNLGISLNEIEWESLNMMGQLETRMAAKKATIEPTAVVAWSLFGGGKKLGGQLKFKDDQLGVQPLVGVRVVGGYSYYWREAHTDINGKFKIPEKWTYKIDFEVNFDSDDFLLEDGHSWYGEDLEIEHNNYKSDWNETFTGNKAKWCVVWTAAYQYWYGENFGLKRPRQNKWWNWSLDIEVFYKNEKDYKNHYSSESIGEYAMFLSTESIGILAYKKPSYSIYSTTIHEIAHASHYWNMKTTSAVTPQSGEFSLLPTAYKETYARGIENYFVSKKYGAGYQRRDYNNQYTGLVEDLQDEDNLSQCKKITDFDKRDKVSGFSIKNIETAFFQNKKFSTMKNYLKKKNPAGKNGTKYTSTALDDLFTCWGL